MHHLLSRLAQTASLSLLLGNSTVHCAPECRTVVPHTTRVGWLDLRGNFTEVFTGGTVGLIRGFQGGQHVEIALRVQALAIDATRMRARFVRPGQQAAIAERSVELGPWSSVIGVPGERENSLLVFVDDDQITALGGGARLIVEAFDAQGRCVRVELDVTVVPYVGDAGR